MISNLVVLLLILAVCILLIGILLIKHIWHVNQHYHIGYLPTVLKKLKKPLANIIQKYYHNKTEQVVLVEAGAGFGHVAEYLANKYKFKKVLAIEDEFSLFWLAKIYHQCKSTKIQFVKDDVVNFQNPQNSLIYSYLLPDIVTEMYRRGRLKNSILVSLTFSIKDIEPDELINIPNFQQKLLIYDFRKN